MTVTQVPEAEAFVNDKENITCNLEVWSIYDLMLLLVCAFLCVLIFENLNMVFKDNFLCWWPQFAGREEKYGCICIWRRSKWGFSYSSYCGRSQISIYVLGQPPPKFIHVASHCHLFLTQVKHEFWTVRKPGGNQWLHLWIPCYIQTNLKNQSCSWSSIPL